MTEAASARWARSGLALLTGHETPTAPPRDYAGALQALLDAARPLGLDLDMRLFTERAAELGLSRHGRTSANGTARLIEAADGWLAVNLARPDDRDAVPAWIGCGLDDEPWTALAHAARRRTATDLAETGQALGIPAAVAGSRGDAQSLARGGVLGARVERRAVGAAPPNHPLVIDLSSLWAGPLCAQLLGLAGARVVKVESAGRPDAARHGPTAFFDRLHHGHESAVLDFASPEGRSRLIRLLARADVVIEGSRPRALEQLGVDLAAAFAAQPALVWISLTAYGRAGPRANRVGFGDDAAAAGGLLAWDAAGAPVFVGDALADPVAGLIAATAALRALAQGGGALVDVALRDAAAAVAAAAPIAEAGAVTGGEGVWRWNGTLLAAPSTRPVTGQARQLGADTAAILAELT